MVGANELVKNKERNDIIGKFQNELKMSENINASTMGNFTYKESNLSTKKGKKAFRKLTGLYKVLGEMKSMNTFVSADMINKETREELKRNYGISSKDLEKLVSDYQQGNTPEFNIENGEDAQININPHAVPMEDNQADALQMQQEQVTINMSQQEQASIHGRISNVADYNNSLIKKIRASKNGARKTGIEKLNSTIKKQRQMQNLNVHQAVKLSDKDIHMISSNYDLSKKEIEKLAIEIQAGLYEVNNTQVERKSNLKDFTKEYKVSQYTKVAIDQRETRFTKEQQDAIHECYLIEQEHETFTTRFRDENHRRIKVMKDQMSEKMKPLLGEELASVRTKEHSMATIYERNYDQNESNIRITEAKIQDLNEVWRITRENKKAFEAELNQKRSQLAEGQNRVAELRGEIEKLSEKEAISKEVKEMEIQSTQAMIERLTEEIEHMQELKNQFKTVTEFNNKKEMAENWLRIYQENKEKYTNELLQADNRLKEARQIVISGVEKLKKDNVDINAHKEAVIAQMKETLEELEKMMGEHLQVMEKDLKEVQEDSSLDNEIRMANIDILTKLIANAQKERKDIKEFNVNNLPQTSNIKAMLTALEKMTYEVSVKCDKIVDRIIMANKENRNRKINTVELKLKKKMNL